MAQPDSAHPAQPNQNNRATRESIDDNAVIESPTAAGEALGRDMLVTSDSAKPNQAKGKKRQKGNVVCRFYQTSGGCRAGSSCPFLHNDQQDQNGRGHRSGHESSAAQQFTFSGVSTPVPSIKPSSSKRQYLAPSAPAERIVSRPLPRAQVVDPRGFQIEQLRRRFMPKETSNEDGSVDLAFKLAPSDPDFPFELSALDCLLHVPVEYPNGSPSLRVTNQDMGRGYQLNIETGFNDILRRSPKGTLLQVFKALDRDLETLLSAPKAETIKIVAYQNKYGDASKEVDSQFSQAQPTELLIYPKRVDVHVPKPSYTSEQLSQAKARRDADIRQLEARLGRLPQFTKSSDGLSYTIPIEPRRRQDLPAYMQSIGTIKLTVPSLYNLEPCKMEIFGTEGPEVRALRESFKKYATQNPQVTLFAMINRLSQNMHLMAAETIEDHLSKESETGDVPSSSIDATLKEVSNKNTQKPLGDKSHVIVIPRPPEWSHHGDFDDESTEESSSFDSEDDNISGEDHLEGTQRNLPSGPEKGILMSLPNLELYGIELLELISLSISIKCNRCKETADATNIRKTNESDTSAIKHVVCRKCSNQMTVGYRMDLMHAHCIRAGYLDLDGCTVVDMLPSAFIPTCSECSTPCPPPGIISVRAESTMAICRECHKRMSFKIPEIKFLQVSATSVRASQAPRRKKKEDLGIRTGEHLPNRGRCKHYSKSYRWFRFSCCSKVFPCDKCHDVASDHPNEHANRMICGYCSREQNYRPEDCHYCHVSLIAKTGTGFWEGGKGTRDKVRMSKKDPRKYKRRPGTAPAGGSKS